MTLALAAAVQRWPMRSALVAGEATLSFAELGRRAAGVARALERLGIGREQGRPVALLAHHELPTLIAIHALVALGVPFVPVNPRLTPRERGALLELAQPGHVLDLRQTPELVSPTGTSSSQALAPLPDDERPLALLPTSGSTGSPRLVVLSRRAFAASAAASRERLGWRDDDRWLASVPLFHVGGLSVLTRCLDAGRCAVLAPPGDTERLIAAFESQRATMASLVPTQLERLLSRSPEYHPPPWLRLLLVGGARTPERLLMEAARRGWPVLTTYGMTETCSMIATQRPGTINRGECGAGPALAGAEVRVREGVLEVRGPMLLSAMVPAQGPLLDADGWLRTSDLGELDVAGNVHVLGRTNELIVTGGEKVAPAEVERAVERCPGVKESCAFGVVDPTWGHIVALAVVGDVTLSALRSRMEAELAPHKRARAVAVTEALPRLPSGKLDRARTAVEAEPVLVPLSRS